MNIHTVRCGTTFHCFVNCFCFDRADIFRCRVWNHSFHYITYHCKCNTDGRNDLCIIRNGIAKSHFIRTESNQGSGSSADSYQTDLIFLQAIFFCQFHDDRFNFLIGSCQNLFCNLFHCFSHVICQRLHCLARRIGISIGKIFWFNQSQHIRCTGICDRDPLSAFQFDRYIVRRISLFRAEEYDFRIHDFFFRSKYRIVHTCNMCGTWSHIFDTALICPHHTSSDNTEDTHIQTADICTMSAYIRIINGRTSVFDYTDIRRCSSNFKIYTI